MTESSPPFTLLSPRAISVFTHAVLLITAMALPGVSIARGNYHFTCQLESATRYIEVAYLVPEQHVPCEVRYQKNADDGTVLWRANNQAGFCETKAANLVREHTTLGFECESDNLPQDLPHVGQY